MARQESEREDLMAEAVALVRRVELAFPASASTSTSVTEAESERRVVAGCRVDGATSIYFGEDPVYHLDSAGGLKRAYVGGFLYRTQGATLARLDRQRTPTETLLVRHDLSTEELASFRADISARLHTFCDAIAEGRVLRSVPADSPDLLVREIVTIFQSFLARGLPLAPPFAGKK